MAKYKLVIFDMDGTVLDTLDDLTAAVNAALAAFGYSTHGRDAVRTFVGDGIGKLIERALPAGTDTDTVARVLAAFRTYYAAHCKDATRPYAGVTGLLADLRRAGCYTAVLSNKADFAVRELAEQYFPALLHVAVGERAGVPRKPAPDGVLDLMRRFGVSPAEAVYIGDSDVDVRTAANAGVEGIFVTWGFRDADCLRRAGGACIVENIEKLKTCLL